MKKLLAILLFLMIVGEKVPMQKLDRAARVTLQHGRTFAEIDAPEDVARLRKMFSSPAYQKSTSSKEWVGWEYTLTWFDEKDHLLEEFAVRAPTLIDYNGYFYNLTDAKLDFTYFEKLLLPYYMTQDLDDLTAAILGERLIPPDYQANFFSVKMGDRLVSFTDEETIRQSLEKFKNVRVHKAWPDGTVEPNGFYVLTWDGDLGAETFWYRPKDKIFRQGSYACTLAGGKVDTEYLDALLENDHRIFPTLAEKDAAYVIVDTYCCSYTIDDPWTMETLRGMIETVPQEIIPDSWGLGDFLYRVSWFDAEDQWIDEAYIVDTATICYRNNFYHRTEGQFDPDYLDNLLKTAAK